MTNRKELGRDSLQNEVEPRSRSFAALLILAVCAALLFAGFAALGTWQLQRLQWKRDLIERVEQRVHAAPVPAPAAAEWPQVTATSHEYRRVQVTGTFLHDLSTKVQASTRLGSGYWLLTPLRRADGTIVMVNRGFIPLEKKDESARQTNVRPNQAAGSSGQSPNTVVTGLLRLSEPGGGFLRQNDPDANRWYSRDIAAIAAARHLTNVAPYFIDADAVPPDAQAGTGTTPHPTGGLTVIHFPNNHLVYALTWYALALMVAVAGFWVIRKESRVLRANSNPRYDGMNKQ